MSMKHDTSPSFSLGKRWSISLNVLLSVLAVVALVCMVNYLAARHFERVPVSALAQTELSAQTRRILESVTNNVHVTIYYDRADPLYDMINGLLKEYKFANARIGVETIDYNRDASAAQIVKARYKLAADKNLVIFRCNDNTKVVYEKELSDVDLEPLISGKSKEVRRSAFKGELLFTSAIYSVTSPRALKAYFIRGHGEHLPDNTDREHGFSKFAEMLKENNVDWAIATNEIPNDCSLLIIAGPQSSLLPEELAKIEQYLNNGGRALILFNYFSAQRNTGVERVLAEWGVEVGPRVVIDPLSSTAGQDLVASHFGKHAISAPLINSGLHMIYPRPLRKVGRGAHKTDAPNIAELVFTSAGGIVVSDFRNGVPFPSPTDVRTNVPLAVAVEKGRLQGLTAERGTTRIVVVGDSIFWANHMLDSLANRDFAALTVNWLLDRSQLLGSLAPRPIPEHRLVMTESQMTAARWMLLFGMPGTVLLLGAAVWVQRRH
jgi:ABC-2 type transport system permease protein